MTNVDILNKCKISVPGFSFWLRYGLAWQWWWCGSICPGLFLPLCSCVAHQAISAFRKPWVCVLEYAGLSRGWKMKSGSPGWGLSRWVWKQDTGCPERRACWQLVWLGQHEWWHSCWPELCSDEAAFPLPCPCPTPSHPNCFLSWWWFSSRSAVEMHHPWI